MPHTNVEVARLLDELAELIEIAEGGPQAFRARAYRNAARAVHGLTRDVADLSDAELTSVRGIGSSTAKKIREFVETGTIATLERMRVEHPRGQRDLLRVPGIGAKTVQLLREVLGIEDLAGLRAALDDGRLASLPGFGERSQRNLRKAIAELQLDQADRRTPIAQALPLAEDLVTMLEREPAAQHVAYAGSARRFRDTIGDLDLLVVTDDPDAVTVAFTSLPTVREVVASGATKTTVRTAEGMQVDLRVVPPGSLGAALLYFTGSQEHNIRLRERAQGRGWTLNEYALTVIETREVVAAATEEDIYAALGLAWVPPELREDQGELQHAADGTLPRLPTVADLRGDLHDHTTYSGDGRDTMEDLVAAAAERGWEYLAITDHAEDLTINGVSRAGMLEQRVRLRELQERHPQLALLHGVELNIGIDGTIDYDPAFLAGFGFGVASVHSHFRRPPAEQTARVVAAMRNPAVNVIGHLQGRRIGKRPGIELDLDVVLDAAVETGCALEVNCNLDRLDATAEVIREGAARGVTFVISTDAHRIRELDYHRFGVRQAARGGLPKELVANTWSQERFLAWVAAKRSS